MNHPVRNNTDAQGQLDEFIDQTLGHVLGIEDVLASLSKADVMTSSLADVIALEAQIDSAKHLRALFKGLDMFLDHDFYRWAPQIVGTDVETSQRIWHVRRKLNKAWYDLPSLVRLQGRCVWVLDPGILDSERGRKGFERQVAAVKAALLDLGEFSRAESSNEV